jgi:hypothetical protein
VLSFTPLSRCLVKKKDENTGIVWNTRIRVEEFINKYIEEVEEV